jgi:hypothetical protein
VPWGFSIGAGGLIDTVLTRIRHGAAASLVPAQRAENLGGSFAPGATLRAFASYSDQRNGEVTHFSVLRPDASIQRAGIFDLASENLPKPFYSGTAWDGSVTLPQMLHHGTWTLKAEFEGAIYRHAFVVTAATIARSHSRHARPAREPPRR